MLTRKQTDLLLYINQRLQEDGISPSFDEMRDALGLKSKSGIHRLISGLEERGFIRRLAHRARALEVMRLPESAAANAGAPKAAMSNPVTTLGRPVAPRRQTTWIFRSMAASQLARRLRRCATPMLRYASLQAWSAGAGIMRWRSPVTR